MHLKWFNLVARARRRPLGTCSRPLRVYFLCVGISRIISWKAQGVSDKVFHCVINLLKLLLTCTRFSSQIYGQKIKFYGGAFYPGYHNNLQALVSFNGRQH